jgi:hypothetical protein
MHSGKTLSQALAETPAAALIARCERADQAAHHIAASLVESAPLSGQIPRFTCQIREHVLLVFAPSVAQAAKIRQALPRLLVMLQERGLNLSEIRVRVQPGSLAETDSGGASPPRPSVAEIAETASSTAGALQLADKLALTLRPSPLRDAADRLAKLLRARRLK